MLKLRKGASGNIEVADIASAYARDNSSTYESAIKEGKLRYLDKDRAMEWARLEEDNLPLLLPTSHARNSETRARLERDRVSKLLTTSLNTHGSEDIKAQHAVDVKGENEPYVIFSTRSHAARANLQHKIIPAQRA